MAQTMIEKQLGEIFEADAQKLQKRSKQALTIAERIIRNAASVFELIPEYRESAVRASLPDFSGDKKNGNSITFNLRGMDVDVNFFPYQSSIALRRLSLSIRDDVVDEKIMVSLYAGTYREDPNQRFNAWWRENDVYRHTFGGRAALRAITMIRKVDELAKG